MKPLFLSILSFSYFTPAASWAGNLISFDNPNLLFFENGTQIRGYYSKSIPEIEGIRPAFSCDFLFYSINHDAGKNQNTKIQSFYTESSYEKRIEYLSSPGKLSIDGKNWTIALKNQPLSCATAAGGGFYEDNAAPFEIEKKIPATGVFVATKKTHFYNWVGGNFVPRRGYLVKGDIVAAISQNGKYTFVRYVSPDDSAISTEWLQSKDLIDPFPVSQSK